ncbi:MAG: formate dehydrogenase accessory sulfurtransferase FdhD [Kofleriaceae bacterium]
MVARDVLRLEVGALPRPERDEVAPEAALRIVATGRTVATILRTPGHDLELVRGFLHAEGKPAPLRAEPPDAVHVELPAEAFAPRAVASVAGCGVCGRDTLDDLVGGTRPVASSLTVSMAVLATLPAALRAAQPLFAATGGVHAAALFAADGALVVAREDVGRHNAVDKVVGWGLAAGHDLGACVLMLSGRLGFELAHKAARAGIPIVAAVSAPSSLALELAERFGVTAVGFVRDGRATAYTHPARIAP